MIKQALEKYSEAKKRLLSALFDLEKDRGYLRDGFSSLFEFLTLGHHLSEVQAYELVTVIRAMGIDREIPEKLSTGQMNFRTLKTVLPLLNQTVTLEDKREILSSAQGKIPEMAIENIQGKFPNLQCDLATKRMTIIFNQELIDLYERIKSKLSHKYPTGVRLDIAVNETFKYYLGTKLNSSIVSRQLYQQVWSRAKGQCEFESLQGRRCLSKYLLQIDHVIPRSKGGLDELSNLRLLCANHNKDESRIIRKTGV
ncbi:MAG: hypothetical protein Fur0010_22470 [Bdellovibrio sp.]